MNVDISEELNRKAKELNVDITGLSKEEATKKINAAINRELFNRLTGAEINTGEVKKAIDLPIRLDQKSQTITNNNQQNIPPIKTDNSLVDKNIQKVSTPSNLPKTNIERPLEAPSNDFAKPREEYPTLSKDEEDNNIPNTGDSIIVKDNKDDDNDNTINSNLEEIETEDEEEHVTITNTYRERNTIEITPEDKRDNIIIPPRKEAPNELKISSSNVPNNKPNIPIEPIIPIVIPTSLDNIPEEDKNPLNNEEEPDNKEPKDENNNKIDNKEEPNEDIPKEDKKEKPEDKNLEKNKEIPPSQEDIPPIIPPVIPPVQEPDIPNQRTNPPDTNNNPNKDKKEDNQQKQDKKPEPNIKDNSSYSTKDGRKTQQREQTPVVPLTNPNQTNNLPNRGNKYNSNPTPQTGQNNQPTLGRNKTKPQNSTPQTKKSTETRKNGGKAKSGPGSGGKKSNTRGNLKQAKLKRERKKRRLKLLLKAIPYLLFLAFIILAMILFIAIIGGIIAYFSIS